MYSVITHPTLRASDRQGPRGGCGGTGNTLLLGLGLYSFRKFYDLFIFPNVSFTLHYPRVKRLILKRISPKPLLLKYLENSRGVAWLQSHQGDTPTHCMWRNHSLLNDEWLNWQLHEPLNKWVKWEIMNKWMKWWTKNTFMNEGMNEPMKWRV